MSGAAVPAGVGGLRGSLRAGAVTAVFAVAAVTGGLLVVVAGPGGNWTLASNVVHSLLLLAAGWWLLHSPDGRHVGGLLLARQLKKGGEA